MDFKAHNLLVGLYYDLAEGRTTDLGEITARVKEIVELSAGLTFEEASYLLHSLG